jgi:hypothetical protein
MRARFFVRRPTGAPWYVFRILPDVSVQVYDLAEHGWRARPLEPLYRWAVIDGEIGVDEIAPDKAFSILRSLHPAARIRESVA